MTAWIVWKATYFCWIFFSFRFCWIERFLEWMIFTQKNRYPLLWKFDSFRIILVENINQSLDIFVEKNLTRQYFICLYFDIFACLICSITYSSYLGERYTGLGAQTLHPKKDIQDFFLQLHFNRNYIKVTIIYFTMHLSISKWLRRQKCRQWRKTTRQKGVQAKEETISESVFIN